jgi:hypothetical protein
VVVVLVSVAVVVVALAPRAGGKPSISRSKSGHFVSHIISFSIFFLLLLTAGHAKTPSLRLSFSHLFSLQSTRSRKRTILASLDFALGSYNSLMGWQHNQEKTFDECTNY